jgi:hypothetical protein
LDQVAGSAHFHDAGPPQQRPQRNPTVSKNAGALELAHIKTIACQFLNRQATTGLAQ